MTSTRSCVRETASELEEWWFVAVRGKRNWHCWSSLMALLVKRRGYEERDDGADGGEEKMRG